VRTSTPRRRVTAVLAGITVLLAGMVPATAAHAGPYGAAEGSAAVARARVAADVLMSSYDWNKAWFPSSWWNSAVALQTIGDYMERTGDRRYLTQLDRTFERNKGPFPAGELSSDEIWGDFTSRAIDDGMWWALNWIQAYDLTGRRKYLDMAVKIAKFTENYWDATCGGGVWWDHERTYKNAVTNGQWIRLTASLHNRIRGDRYWLGRARQAWDWYAGSGMINSDHLVNDGLNGDCRNNGSTVWTYNQGLAIGGALELWRATRDPRLLAMARRLADAAIDGGLTVDGVLTEWCDALTRTCDDNAKQFKGIFLRYLMDLADTTGDRRYQEFIARQAETIWTRDRDAANRLGVRWAGGTTPERPNIFDWRTQASAMSALIADIPKRAPKSSLAAIASPAQPVVMPGGTGTQKVKIDVGVSVTAPRSKPVKVRIDVAAPEGWSVSPKTGTVTLRGKGDAEPVSGTFPVAVSVPAKAADGHHDVTATVTARPGLSFSTRADVLVAHKADFDTGTADEYPWLWDADGSQSNGVQNRFADGNRYFVYRFPFPSDTTSAQVVLTIDNEYVVEVSPDAEQWTTVLREERRITDGSNKADQVIDLTPYLGPDKAAYVRVSDSFPDDGWGGRVYHVTATASAV